MKNKIAHLLLASMVMLSPLMVPKTQATEATWTGAGLGTDWDTVTNWTPNVVPTNIATFPGTVVETTVVTIGNSSIEQIQFTSGATANQFSLNVNVGSTLNMNGAGITNNTGLAQFFTANGTVNFNNVTTAGTNTQITINNTGTLKFNDTSSIGSLTITQNDGSLVFNQTSNTGYTRNIAGAGTVTKSNTGTLTLSGTSIYLGNTSIDDGALINNGNIQNSPVIVSSRGTYGGVGSSGPLVNNGTVSPGGSEGSIGTLTVNGNYIQGASGSLNIEIAEGGVLDLLQITGIATLAGTLNISAIGNILSSMSTYTFLTAAGGFGGTNFTTFNLPAGLKFVISPLTNSIELITQGTNFASLSSTGNAGIIAQYIDAIVANGTASADLNTALTALSNAAEEGTTALANALNQISPAPYREIGTLAFEQTNSVRQSAAAQQQHIFDNVVMNRLSMDNVPSQQLSSFKYLLKDRMLRAGTPPLNFVPQNTRASKKGAGKFGAFSLTEGTLPVRKSVQVGNSSVWVEPYGQSQRKTNSSPLVGTKANTFGTTIGGDTLVAPNTYLGVLGSIMNSHFDWKQNRGHGDITGYYGGLYGLWLSKTGAYIDGQVILGGTHNKSRRNINFQTINRKAREHHNGLSATTDVEMGYLWEHDNTLVQPFFNFEYVAAHENSFREKGAGSLNIHRGKKTSHFSRTELGPIVSHFFCVGETLVYPALKLSWVQKRPLGNKGKKVTFNFTDQAFGTTVNGDNRIRNLFSPGLSITGQFKNGVYIMGNVNAETGSGERLGQVMFNVGYNF
ncbi:MAG: outer membrane autotransporter barrel protein [uncultured bacterium]|nr:MAG: outer membrane autotransporter barrel protein [uncultured bacterium]OFW69879.1 MAG: hypothetical protein A2X70_04230 [Alphaproteobacteria bacterium GWC2_42_16]OFW73090.1 MAG: hypothetical protein A2Z80_00185 [Alphaproteobacteria bacterium GWA2_41_27]OFW81664.1 MAG: hypothetical protein A3E50_00185 [Alphaproteobacteria bacterium RIFCSPHIGHO2_12_FULL_42_100]OFW85306.1 MAG: hypothetical protein A2W06_00310 [Alphaproteobacteria bacterium RBG_16_42_14]OFW90564.1 MAG: hypothetical protein A3